MQMKLTSNRTHIAMQSTASGTREDGIIKIALQAPAVAGTQRVPLNLGIVIDRSGSMQGQKLADAIVAAQRIVQRLSAEDYCTIVTFDNQVALLADNLLANEANQRLIQHALQSVQAGGSTNLSEGWKLGADTLLRNNQHTTCVNRVMLLTDGEANHGITDQATLGVLSGSYAARNVSTTTYGLGMHYNESLLNTMAQHGQGNHYFIEESNDIERFFGSELNELFAAALQQCTVQLSIPAGFSYEVLGGMPHTATEQTVTLSIGTMIAHEQRSIYLRLIPADHTVPGSYTITATFTGTDSTGTAQQFEGTLALQLCSVIEAQQHPEDSDISAEAANVDMAYQSALANNYNRMGDYGNARQVMSAAKMRSASLSRHSMSFYDAIETEMMAPRSMATQKRAMAASARGRNMSIKDLAAMEIMLAEYEASGEQGVHVDLLRRQIEQMKRSQS
jgi:Ca-activated chloride channel family protein